MCPIQSVKRLRFGRNSETASAKADESAAQSISDYDIEIINKSHKYGYKYLLL